MMPVIYCRNRAATVSVSRRLVASACKGIGASSSPLTTAFRFKASSSSSSSASTPPQHASTRHENTGKSGTIIDTPAPPRPAFYVPPEERSVDDESLAFMQPGSPLRAINDARRHRLAHEAVAAQQEQHAQSGNRTDALAEHDTESTAATTVNEDAGLSPAPPLEAGQGYAPSLAEREQPKRHFMDADAVRLQSTSVHAGHSLLKGKIIDSGDFDLPPRPPTKEDAGAEQSFAAHATRQPAHAPTNPLGSTEPKGSSSGGRREASGAGGMFRSKLEDARLEDLTEDPGRAKVAADAAAVAAQKPRRRQLEEDIKKLEYYFGSPQYPAMLKAFRDKYGDDKPNEGVRADGEDDSAMGEAERAYSTDDVERGLESQPVDYLRSSSKLQSHLTAGPHAYDPVTVMQQHGLMRFQGYAFPPTTELGKLKGVDDYKALQDAHKENAVVKRLRKAYNAVTRRQSDKDDFLATDPKAKGDTSLVYRTVGLDAVQRRQMRFMLTDFDYADRHTAFHVMMSYPYTDWLHAFYMVLVGWALYQLQVRYDAYDFYDEYLGLDLRQVPSLKKPFLIGVTCCVMVFLLFQPLLVASIATNRAYRIVKRRPIGPP